MSIEAIGYGSVNIIDRLPGVICWWFGLALFLLSKPAGTEGGCTWLLEEHWLPDRWGQSRVSRAVPAVAIKDQQYPRWCWEESVWGESREWEWIVKVIWQHGIHKVVHVIPWRNTAYGFGLAAGWRIGIFKCGFFQLSLWVSATELSAFTLWKAIFVLKTTCNSVIRWLINERGAAGKGCLADARMGQSTQVLTEGMTPSREDGGFI